MKTSSGSTTAKPRKLSMRNEATMNTQILTGIRVLELGQLIAGPFAGKTLADFGVASYFGIQTFSTGIYKAWLSMDNRIAAAQLATTLPGGLGAVREVCDWLIAARAAVPRRHDRRGFEQLLVV